MRHAGSDNTFVFDLRTSAQPAGSLHRYAMLDYQIGTPNQKGFLIAHAIEVGLLIPLAAILALGSVLAVRRRKDPARNVFLSLRVAAALYFV